MTYTALQQDFLGGGPAASLPNAAVLGPTIPPGCCAFYYATDTNVLYQLASGDVAWQIPVAGSSLEIDDGGGPVETGVDKITFTGAGVTVTNPATGEVSVAIPGGGGGGGVTEFHADASGDLGTTPAYADIPGLSLTLAAGTYILLAQVSVTSVSGINTVTATLYNQTDNVSLASSAASLGGSGYWNNINMSCVVVLAGTKTVRVAALQNNSVGMVVKQYGDGAAPSPANVVGTRLIAMKIA